MSRRVPHHRALTVVTALTGRDCRRGHRFRQAGARDGEALGPPVAALPGEHPLRCWHVLAAVQPAERLQHPGKMGIRPEQAGFDAAELALLAIAEAHRMLLTCGLLRDAAPAYRVPPAQARS